MKRKMTFLARGSKSGFGRTPPNAERIGLAASTRDAPTICANAIIPKPAPMVLRASRRVRGWPPMKPQPWWCAWSCLCDILVLFPCGPVGRSIS
jgi:hypothetical protein